MGKMSGGGVEHLLMNLYRHMDKTKVQFDFLIDEDSTIVPKEEIDSLGGRIITIPPYQHIVSYMRSLERLFREEEWSIVHSHINSLSVFPLRAAKNAGVPIRIAHSHSTSSKAEGYKYYLKQFLRTQSNRYPTFRMACGQYAGKWLFGESNEVFVLPNAIDLARFEYSEERRNKVRSSLGLGEDVFVVGHVGRFAKQKNHRFLIEAFVAYVQQNPRSVLLLAGSGPLEDEIKKQVRGYGISSKVMFLGQRSDIDELYQAFDAFVLPSIFEGLAISGIEAQAAGLPCLFSDQIARETSVTADARFLSLDQADLWAKEFSAISNDRMRHDRRLGPEARDNLAIYDIAQSARVLQEVYERLLDD